MLLVRRSKVVKGAEGGLGEAGTVEAPDFFL